MDKNIVPHYLNNGNDLMYLINNNKQDLKNFILTSEQCFKNLIFTNEQYFLELEQEKENTEIEQEEETTEIEQEEEKEANVQTEINEEEYLKELLINNKQDFQEDQYLTKITLNKHQELNLTKILLSNLDKQVLNVFMNNQYEFENVILITSKIYVSSKSFSYSNIRSIYTKQERFQQTLDTISSIKKYIPNIYIVLFDNSNFNECEIEKLTSYVNKFINITDNNLLNHFTNNHRIKAYGEIAQTKFALDEICKLNFKNFFKISGRYLINENFKYKNYINDHNIFKIIKQKSCYTCFYKISKNNFEEYFNVINKLIITPNLKLSYETILPYYLNHNLKKIDILGVTQNISVWEDKSKI